MPKNDTMVHEGMVPRISELRDVDEEKWSGFKFRPFYISSKEPAVYTNYKPFSGSSCEFLPKSSVMMFRGSEQVGSTSNASDLNFKSVRFEYRAIKPLIPSSFVVIPQFLQQLNRLNV
jgi:hypothetical protein